MTAQVLIVAGAAIFLVYRQFTSVEIQPRRLILIPLVLGYFGVSALIGGGTPGASHIVALAANAITAVALGLWRGTTFRIWSEGGAQYMRGGVATLIAWLATIGTRVAIGAFSYVMGTGLAGGTADIALMLALTFAAQNMVIWLRMQSASPAAVWSTLRE